MKILSRNKIQGYKIQTRYKSQTTNPKQFVSCLPAGRQGVLFLGICLFLVSCFLVIAPKGADAAVLYLDPPEAEIYTGDTFIAELRLDTEGETINTIGASVFALGDELTITDFSTGQSEFSMFIQGPEVSDSGDSASFQAIALDGFEGDGIVGKVFLRADKPGFTMARISLDSQVFLHDGEGTEAEMNFEQAEYSVTDRPENSPSVESDTHPISSKWYTEDRARVTWEPKEGARYLYAFDSSPMAEPSQEVEDGVGEVELDVSEDGIYYFRLSECVGLPERERSPEQERSQSGDNCSSIITKTIMKDATPPEEFEVFSGSGQEAYEGDVFISFAATDLTSGVDKYEVQEDGGEWVEAKSPYVLENQSTRIVRVKAIDEAGNERISELNIKAQANKGYGIPPFVGIIILAAGALGAGFVYMRKRKSVMRNA